MDFTYAPAEERFRRELRAWLADALPPGWGKTVFVPQDEHEAAMFRIDWERKLYAGGWACIGWPREHGGRDASLSERAIHAEELALARAPESINIIGHNLAGQTILHHGTPAQKARFLPEIISSREIWCQGFSEPNAGIGPGGGAHPCRPQGWPLYRQRAESLDQLRPVFAMVPGAGAHQQRWAKTSWAESFADRHEKPRYHAQAAAADIGRDRIQRNLFR